MKKHYIKAVADLLSQGRDVDAVLANLARVVREKGHQKLHAQILEGVQAELVRRKKREAPEVTVASSKDAAVFKDAIESSLKKLGGSLEEAQFKTDQTLIGGFVAVRSGILINNSYKEKLVALYRSITK